MERILKLAVTILAVALLLVGVVWAGQGADLIGGSFMTGERTWLVIGLICILLGTMLLIWANTGHRFDQNGDVACGLHMTEAEDRYIRRQRWRDTQGYSFFVASGSLDGELWSCLLH
jgi:hypothetical protein